jgi:hypothetical protein
MRIPIEELKNGDVSEWENIIQFIVINKVLLEKQLNPIVINENREVIIGSIRLEVYKRYGLTWVDCVIEGE